MDEIKVKAGENIEFNVPVAGEPPATKAWDNDGKPILDSLRVTLHNEDYLTKLKITDTTRKDSGPYTLSAENRNGRDSYTVKVTVLGKSMYQPNLGFKKL